MNAKTRCFENLPPRDTKNCCYRYPRNHTSKSQLLTIFQIHGLLFGDYLLNNSVPFKHASRIYEYDNGPRHTIDFEPNTFVDITEEWPRAAEWLGRLMAIRDNQPYNKENIPNSVQAKETLARYRGATCGVQYAEAVHSLQEYPQEIF